MPSTTAVTRTPVRWSARTPGMPPRMARFRFMSADAGAAGTVAVDAQSTDTTAQAATTAAAATEAAPQAAAGEWDGKVESLPEPVQKIIRDLRDENATRRTKLTTAETAQQAALRALAKAAGIELPGDEQAPDPAELARTVADSQAAARTAQVELAVYRAAGTHQGDPAALLDSRAFLAKVTALDPAAADFQTQVDAAIKAAITENPKLRAAQVAGSSSVDHAGGTGEGGTKPTTLEDAIEQKMRR